MGSESKGTRTGETLKQKITFTQLELNRLKSLEKSGRKRVEIRLEIILGAEAAKAMHCDIEQVGEELVMGVLLSVSDLNDIEKVTYIKADRKFLAQMDRRQK